MLSSRRELIRPWHTQYAGIITSCWDVGIVVHTYGKHQGQILKGGLGRGVGPAGPTTGPPGSAPGHKQKEYLAGSHIVIVVVHYVRMAPFHNY